MRTHLIVGPAVLRARRNEADRGDAPEARLVECNDSRLPSAPFIIKTARLLELANRLAEDDCTGVAMEATGGIASGMVMCWRKVA